MVQCSAADLVLSGLQSGTNIGADSTRAAGKMTRYAWHNWGKSIILPQYSLAPATILTLLSYTISVNIAACCQKRFALKIHQRHIRCLRPGLHSALDPAGRAPSWLARESLLIFLTRPRRFIVPILSVFGCCCCCDSPAGRLLSSVYRLRKSATAAGFSHRLSHCKLRRTALTVEQMLYGVWCHSTLWTDI